MPKSIYTEDHQVLVTILRNLRTSAGLTQHQLADRLGRTQAFVSAVEADGRRLDLIQVRDWAEACESNLATLVAQFDMVSHRGGG